VHVRSIHIQPFCVLRRTIGERDGYTPMHGAGFQGRATIAQMLKDHGVPLRTKHDGDGYEPAIRSCWGREERHTETLKWFLDNGVPVDDIYSICMTSTSNEKTKALLVERKGDNASDGANPNDEL